MSDRWQRSWDEASNRVTPVSARSSFLGGQNIGKIQLSKADRSTQRRQLPRGVPRLANFIGLALLSILIANTWDSSMESDDWKRMADATCPREWWDPTSVNVAGDTFHSNGSSTRLADVFQVNGTGILDSRLIPIDGEMGERRVIRYGSDVFESLITWYMLYQYRGDWSGLQRRAEDALRDFGVVSIRLVSIESFMDTTKRKHPKQRFVSSCKYYNVLRVFRIFFKFAQTNKRSVYNKIPKLYRLASMNEQNIIRNVPACFFYNINLAFVTCIGAV